MGARKWDVVALDTVGDLADLFGLHPTQLAWYAVVHGPTRANRARHPDFEAHLLGRISWVDASNPTRGAKLRRMCDQITW